MSRQDPIADMLVSIKNAQIARKAEVVIPCSKVKLSILKVLQNEGYINDYVVEPIGVGKEVVRLQLKYYQNAPVIEKIARVSRPSKRVYSSSADLPMVRAGLGVAIVSTSRGVMSDSAARAANLGGEVICIVE